MKMRSRFLAATAMVAIVVTAALPRNTRAQGTDVPCKVAACGFTIDWGSGKTSGSYPPDRRYGSGDDFESKFRSAMAAHGYRLTDRPSDGGLTMTARPTMKDRVMCDSMAGTNPDMNCTAMIQFSISYASGDSKVKAPAAIRINNRCASGDIYMSHKVFAQYAADMIWYQFEGQAAKAERPISNC